MQEVGVGVQCRRSAGEDDLPSRHHVRTAADAQREVRELLHQEDRHAVAMQSLHRIRKLVDRMEIFGDSRRIERQPVNIHQVLDHVRRIAEASFAKGIRFVENYDPSLPPIAGDRDQLIQVFLNLTKNAADAIADLRVIFELLPAFGVAECRYSLDLALARGLDYYTGPVFEATVTEPRVGSVGGAGRYDGLVGSFLGRPVPATGMSLGLERIIEVVREHNLLPAPSSVADVAVVVMKDTVADAAKLAHAMRDAGLRVDFSLQPQRSLGDQLKLADRRGIPVAERADTCRSEPKHRCFW